MRHLVEATQMAVKQENWYSALALALSMPDIAGRIAYPELAKASEKRYTLWFDKYLAPTYALGAVQFMAGGDCYGLRCAFLHQGEFALDDQRAAKVLDKVHITFPSGVHSNLIVTGPPAAQKRVLQLSVDRFCLDMCDGIEKWLDEVKDDVEIQKHTQSLAKITSINQPF